MPKEPAMAEYANTSTGQPCWIDLLTSDPERARRFYRGVFGWTDEDPGPEFGGYVNFLKDGAPVAGMMQNSELGPGQPDAWTVYLQSADVRSTARAVAAHGGLVINPPVDVADLGSMAVVADPSGARVGVWQPGRHRGFGVLGGPGAPAWFELLTHRYDDAVRFYRDAFGWDTEVAVEDEDFRYTTLGVGEGRKAGIMDMAAERFSPDAPPAWSVYIGSADVDATLERIEELDGAILEPAEDTPFGRLATAVDPTGATFKLVSVR
jgi:uncharacterized protein